MWSSELAHSHLQDGVSSLWSGSGAKASWEVWVTCSLKNLLQTKKNTLLVHKKGVLSSAFKIQGAWEPRRKSSAQESYEKNLSLLCIRNQNILISQNGSTRRNPGDNSIPSLSSSFTKEKAKPQKQTVACHRELTVLFGQLPKSIPMHIVDSSLWE